LHLVLFLFILVFLVSTVFLFLYPRDAYSIARSLLRQRGWVAWLSVSHACIVFKRLNLH